jgi:hypothetical protein
MYIILVDFILLLLTEITNKVSHISYNVKILYEFYGVLKLYCNHPWRMPPARGDVQFIGSVH